MRCPPYVKRGTAYMQHRLIWRSWSYVGRRRVRYGAVPCRCHSRAERSHSGCACGTNRKPDPRSDAARLIYGFMPGENENPVHSIHIAPFTRQCCGPITCRPITYIRIQTSESQSSASRPVPALDSLEGRPDGSRVHFTVRARQKRTIARRPAARLRIWLFAARHRKPLAVLPLLLSHELTRGQAHSAPRSRC